jgi:hypothetical protein
MMETSNINLQASRKLQTSSLNEVATLLYWRLELEGGLKFEVWRLKFTPPPSCPAGSMVEN